MWVWQPLKPSVAGVTFTQSYAETLSLSETLGIKRIFKKSFAETLGTPGLSETLGKKVKKVFAETASLAETLARKFTKTFSETLSLSEALIKKVKKPLTETTSLSETLDKVVIPAPSGGYAGKSTRPEMSGPQVPPGGRAV